MGENKTTGRSMLIGIFRDRESIENAYNTFQERNHTKDDISLVISDETRKKHYSGDVKETEIGTKADEGAGKGSAIGGTIGTILDVIAVIGTSLVIPGRGIFIVWTYCRRFSRCRLNNQHTSIRPLLILRRVIHSVLLTISTYSLLFAQHSYSEGYIITVQNDTLNGEIREKNNQEIYFKNKATGKTNLYSIKEVQSYSKDGVKRIAAQISKDNASLHYFLKERLRGYVSLYELIVPQEEWTFVLQKGDGIFTPLVGNQSYSTLVINFGDCEDAYFNRVRATNQFQYTYSYLARLIKLYNQCVFPQTTQEIKSKFEGSLELIAGVAQNHWTYSFSSNSFARPSVTGPLSTSYFVPFGVSYTIQPGKRWSVVTEFFYNSYKGTRHYTVQSTTSTYYYTLNAKEKYLKLGALGRYVFWNRSYRTYLKIGPTFNRDLQFSIVETDIGQWNRDFKFRKNFGYGYSFGVGTEKKVSRSKAVYAELRYYWHTVQDKVTHVGAHQSLQLMMGVSFR